jgi:hypothetical protein
MHGNRNMGVYCATCDVTPPLIHTNKNQMKYTVVGDTLKPSLIKLRRVSAQHWEALKIWYRVLRTKLLGCLKQTKNYRKVMF